MKRLDLDREDLWFLIPFGIFNFISIFRWSFLYNTVENVYVPICLVCMGLVALRELRYVKNYTKKEYIGLVIALFMFYISFKLKEGTVMYSCFLIFCAKNTDIRKVLWILFISSSLSLIVVLGCSYFEIIHDYILTAPDGRIRHYLGFTYTLVPPAIYFNIAAVYGYLRKENITWIECILLFVFNYLIYDLSASRLSYYMTIVLLVVLVVFKIKPKLLSKSKIVSTVLVFSFILSMLLSIGVSWKFNYQNVFLEKMNVILENRLEYGHNSLIFYGFNLLENDIQYHGNALDFDGTIDNTVVYNYVDCFYIQYLQRFGIAFFGLLMGLITYVLWKAKKANNIFLLTIFMLFAAHAIIDDLVFALYFNSFWIFIGYLMNKTDNGFKL